MNLIAALNDAYDHIPNAPQPGYSKQKISAVFVLRNDGEVAQIIDIRDTSGKKPVPLRLDVPNPPKRTVGISCSFLWDKTSYVLGLTATPKDRTAKEHECFIEYHKTLLADTQDEGLKAFLLFLDKWNPEERRQNMPPGWHEDLLDENIIFVLESDKASKLYLHNRPAAKAIWAKANEPELAEGQETFPFCSILGEEAQSAQLHPSIKGVFGAQSSGAALVSFNKDAFTSYGHEQGENAQISVQAAEKYTGALNLFLAKGSGHNLLIGDTTLIFWAKAGKEAVERQAAGSFLGIFNEAPDEKELAGKAEKEQAKEIAGFLARVRANAISDNEPLMQADVSFYILGLAPNAARLVIRFGLESSFGHIIRNYQRFINEMEIDPPAKDWKTKPPSDLLYPPFFRYLQETALQGKRENVNSRLAAEWMKSILTGRLYPQSLLDTILGRIARDDTHINALRASILKAVLMRNYNKGGIKPMLDLECKDKGYLLGRLFAVYEQIQYSALGSKVNATVRDKYYAAASVQPLKIFPIIDRNSVNHLAKLRKDRPGAAVNMEKLKGDIYWQIAPTDNAFPRSFSKEDQALFGLGYYHQKQEFFKKKDHSEENA